MRTIFLPATKVCRRVSTLDRRYVCSIFTLLVFVGLLVSAVFIPGRGEKNWRQGFALQSPSLRKVVLHSDDTPQPSQTQDNPQQDTQDKPGGLLRRFRNRIDSFQPLPTQDRPLVDRPLVDRMRQRLGGDPNTRLIPGLMGNDTQNRPADFQSDSAESNVQPAGFNSPTSPQIVSSEAIIGSPYNVGHIVFHLAPEDTLRWQSRAIFVSDSQGRIQFPVVMPTFVDRLTEQVSDQIQKQPREINVWFLFVGRQPLDVTIHAAVDHFVTIQPEAVRRIRQRLMTQNWWRQFNAMLDEQSQASDYPPLIQAYLGSMVQQKMGLQPPLLQRKNDQQTDPMTSTWYLLTGAESLQVDSMRELMLGAADTAPATLPLPQNIPWQDHQFEPEDPNLQIEPIAQVIPHECFYLRFGTWANQIWLKQLIEEHGGDLSRMVRLRGYQSMVGDVFRDQLALQSSQLDDLFGGTLIEDVAVIGLDTFFNDGAAAGIVFQAKNGLLANSMSQKRKDFAKQNADKGVTLEEVAIGQQQGTLLQSPDGKVRSLMVTAGDFILVTTSFSLAQRFLQSTQGIRTLGQSAEFQNARQQMPLSRDDTIFVYFSTAFLENLLSPHYQIELKRRLRSITEIQTLQLASWSATAQQVPIPDGANDWDLVPLPQRIEALQAAGLLPKGFNRRPDESQLALMQDLIWDEDSVNSSLDSPSLDSPSLDSPQSDSPTNTVAPGDLRGKETLESLPDAKTRPESLDSGNGTGELEGLELEGPGQPAAKKQDSGSLLGSMLGVFGGSSKAKQDPEKKSQDSKEPNLLSGKLSDGATPLQPLPLPKAKDVQPKSSSDARHVSFDEIRGRSAVGGLLFGDTHRGVRGWMIPVADMQVTAVTPTEQAWYQERAKYFADNWGQTDPIMVGIKRFRLADSKERVVIDGRVAPFGSQKYAWLTDNIGPPMYLRPAKTPDDVIRVEASIGEGTMLQSVGAHQLFASVQRDAQQLSSIDPSEWWTTLKLIQDTPGYIGSWPTAGWLDLLPMLGGRPDAEGFTHSIGRKIWRMQHEGFSVVATSRERLEKLRPHLQMVEAEHPAQLRLEVADLNDTQLASWTNALWRQRSWQASVANTRLLHLLMQHFRMPAEKAKQNAQSLLNAKLICSLDGTYQLRGPMNVPQPETVDIQQPVVDPRISPLSYFWVSDRWPNDNQQAADAWAREQSPLLKWFRGALLEVLQEDQRFLVHGYLDVSREVKETAALPGFDLFKGFSFK